MFTKIKLIFFTLFVSGLYFTSCNKDDNFIQNETEINISSNAETNTSSRTNFSDSLWTKPSASQLNDLWQDMMFKANVDEIGGFLYENGFFNWEYAHLLKQYSPDEYIISIPTIENDSISSILFAAQKNGGYNYLHITLDDLNTSTDNLVNSYGVQSTLVAILATLTYEQLYGGYMHNFLLEHLIDDRLGDEIHQIEQRGWCLIEVILYDFDIASTVGTDPCPCYYKNTLTGHQIYGVSKDFNPETDDPTWAAGNPFQAGKYIFQSQATGADIKPGIIHGNQIVQEGYTVYHFWSWCPDEFDQDPWQYNWTTNTVTNTGGGDLPTGSHWDYDFGRWSEDVKDCMFAFDDPRFTEKINQVESDLISSSCGEAAEYNIKLIIDQTLLRLCELYYDNVDGSEGGPPINIGYGLDETVTSIMTEIDNSVYYSLGTKICKVCEEHSDTESCIEDVDNCPPEGYEECVEDVLCEYAIESFAGEYGLDLSQVEIDAILENVSSCAGNEFEEEVAEILAELMEDCLQYDFVGCDESPNGICPETFNFIATGNGFTCEVNSISFKYFGAENFTRFVGTLCIQTNQRDIQGNLLSAYEASELMTEAWTHAQFLTGAEFRLVNHSLTTQQYKELFVENLYFGMSLHFQNNGTSISISSGPCSGSIPRSKPKYSRLC